MCHCEVVSGMCFIILSAAVYEYWVVIYVTIALDFRKLLFSSTWFLSLKRDFFLPCSFHSCEMELIMSSEPEMGVVFWSPVQICFECRVQLDVAALSSDCSEKSLFTLSLFCIMFAVRSCTFLFYIIFLRFLKIYCPLF